MDPIMAEKIEAMKKYKKGQFVNSIISLHSFIITALMLCTLFCAYPFWFSSICPSFNYFASIISIQNFKSFFSNPKCLFVVGNAIVAILVVESKLTGSSSSPANDIYDDYVQRSWSRDSPLVENKEERKVEVMKSIDHEDTVKNMSSSVEEIDEYCDCINVEREKGEELEEVEVVNDEEAKEKEVEVEVEEEREEEEEVGLAAEELNKRVEDFIARVNRRRWLEEKLLLAIW